MNDLPARIEAHLNTTPLANNLTPLFCDTLRWGAPRGMTPQPLPGSAPGDRSLTAVPVAHLSGVRVFRVDWPEDHPPTITERRKVQRTLAPVYAEHLLCYVTRDGQQAAFVWPRKRDDGKIELRTLPYEVGSPARTTFEQLAELAFRLDELGPSGQPPVGTVISKLDAAFNVEAVTKLFYQEIANWYFSARDCEEVVLPKDIETEEDRALFLIRLLTRLIFCWFLRKKRDPQTGEGLLPDALFEEHSIRQLLRDAAIEACTYYPAILQNLFFATLNTEMDKPGEPPSRRFITEANVRRSDDHMIHTFWRNARHLRDPEVFAQMLQRVPFLNGGLFECLDERVQKGSSALTEEVRIDGFSNDPEKHPKLPNYLFFGPDRIEDLSSAYGDPSRRRETVRPLLSILRSYNFTLTENTPFDQEVALDPELLGHVFENLLAAYNPETGTVARKATGSFYTPRVVVDWMVDQALLIYLNKALDRADNVAASDQADPRLVQLLSWEDDRYALAPVETETLIDAIDHLKVLDPACGSGAFPIGMLQKLVLILHKLDPENHGWSRRQEAAIAHIESPPAREDARRAFERAFAHDNDDYGRKLYLIEKCLYGVDIQPIACQIAKLRFFIALIVDQSIDPNEANYGILPLPNLETKVVAADTLLGFRPGQLRLDDERVQSLEEELKQVQHDYFTVRRYRDKRALRARDRELCADLARMLADSGNFTPYDTQRIAEWNPYRTNTHASFFDPAWMFGLHPAGDRDGGVFDIVIGNPPYVRQEQLRGFAVTGSDGQPRPLKEAFKERYECYTGTADLYVYFFERSLQLLRVGGVLSFITSNKYMRAAYGEKLRAYLAYASHPHAILDFSDAPVFTSIAYPCIIITEKVRHVGYGQLPNPATFDQSGRIEQLLVEPDRTARVQTWNPGKDVRDFPDIFDQQAHALAQRDLKPDGWRLERSVSLRLLDRLRQAGQPLGEYIRGRFYRGIVTGLNKAFVVERATRDRLIAEHSSSAEVLKPFLRGRDVKRWRCEFQELWLIFTRRGCDIRQYPAIHEHLKQFKNQLMPGVSGGRKPGHYEWHEIQDTIDYWREFEKPKILYPDIAVEARFAVDREMLYPDCTLFLIPEGSAVVLAVLNSSVNRYFFPQICPKIRGGFMRFKSIYVEQIPIPITNPEQQRWCERLAEALIWLHGQDPTGQVGNAPVTSMQAYFEQWLNGLVYELFFPDELHGRKLTLFEETARLNPPDLSTIPELQKLIRLRALFEQAYDSHAMLRSMLFSLGSLEVVRIIEEPLDGSIVTAQDMEP